MTNAVTSRAMTSRANDDRRRPKKKEGWLGELFDF